MSIDTVVATASALTDTELVRRIPVLAGRERATSAELVAHLAEMDARRLYLGLGYGSLFAYCTAVLHLAEHAALNRIDAARLSRRLPVVLDLLAEGAINLATLRVLAPHLTAENHIAVLAEARHRSKRDVECLATRLAPRPDVPTTIRRLPTVFHEVGGGAAMNAPPARMVDPSAGSAPRSSLGEPSAPPPAHSTPAEPASRRAVIEPLAPTRFRLQLTMGQETHDDLRALQDLLRREIPDGDAGVIVARALALLRRQVETKKIGAPRKALKAGTTTGSGIAVVGGAADSRPGKTLGSPLLSKRAREAPTAVRRESWDRDEGRCAYVAPDGTRCSERAFIEFHHLEPWAVGGEATIGNIALRCHPHNRYEAERDFGTDAIGPRLAPGRVGVAGQADGA